METNFYEPPELTHFGSLAELTLTGGTTDFGDNCEPYMTGTTPGNDCRMEK